MQRRVLNRLSAALLVLFVAILIYKTNFHEPHENRHNSFVFDNNTTVYLDKDAIAALDKIQDDLFVIPNDSVYKLISVQIMPNKMYILNYGDSKTNVSIHQVVGGDIIGVVSPSQKIMSRSKITIRCGKAATLLHYIAGDYEWLDIRWHEDGVAVAIISHNMDRQSMIDIANSLVRLKTGRHACQRSNASGDVHAPADAHGHQVIALRAVGPHDDWFSLTASPRSFPP